MVLEELVRPLLPVGYGTGIRCQEFDRRAERWPLLAGAARLRRRAVRRLVATMGPAAQAEYRKMRVATDEMLGRTRPISFLSRVGAALHEQGMTATETVALFAALGIEAPGVDLGAARKRLQNRADRAKARSSTRKPVPKRRAR